MTNIIKVHISLLLLFLSCQIGVNAQWVKLSIDKTGVYEITGNDLRKAGIDIKNIESDEILFFTTSSSELPQESNQDNLVQNWVEIPTQFIGENKINRKSKYRFYATGSLTRSLADTSHYYDKYNYVYIQIGGGTRNKIKVDSFTGQSGLEVSTLPCILYKEEDKFNVVESGREWYGDFINSEYFQNLTLDSYSLGTEVELEVKLISTASSEKKLITSESNKTVGSTTLPRSFYDRNDRFRRYNRVGNEVYSRFTFVPNSNELRLKWLVEDPESFQDGAYLDKYSITYMRETVLGNDQWAGILSKEGEASSYLISTDSELFIWDVGDPFSPKILDNKAVNLEDRSQTELRFFGESQVYKPVKIEMENREILKPIADINHLIITPKAYKSAANTLAQYRNTQDEIKSKVVTTEAIYQTYSGGKVDPTAIRNFIRQQWEFDKNLQYVLLLGDASFDFKNNMNLDFVEIKNHIPTYQSRESLEPIYSFSSDDYYGFLDANEGSWPEGFSQFNSWNSTADTTHKLDVAIGRIPAKSLIEAYNAIDKIIAYETRIETLGSWRNKILFVADDADFNIHLRDAERFASQVSQINPNVEVRKLYLDAFEQENVGSAVISTEAQRELDRNINEGTFIVNYNGHGSELGWTDEKLLTLGQIQRWTNSSKLPIFFTATCEYGKYDNPSRVSGAELSLLQPSTGAIALLTTTRPVFASTNFTINKAFYDELYKNNTERLGDIFKRTKNNSIRGEINRNFTLLGDPALKLPKIKQSINITDVITNGNDSLKWESGCKITLKGNITSYAGSGKVVAKIFAPQKKQTTKGNGANPAPFESYEEKLFEGIQDVNNGSFTFEFIVPELDIDTSQFGKAFFYAANADSTSEFGGVLSNFKISSKSNPNTDSEGPAINLLSENSRDLLFRIEDPSGINPNSLKLVVNDTLSINTENGFLSEFGFEVSTFQTVLSSLSIGTHKIQFSAADSYNNESSKTFFITLAATSIEVVNLVVYPNPTSELLRLNVKHNASSENLSFVLNILDMKGQKILTERRVCYICDKEIQIGTNLGQQEIENGNYLYQLIITNIDKQEKTVKAGKFLFWK